MDSKSPSSQRKLSFVLICGLKVSFFTEKAKLRRRQIALNFQKVMGYNSYPRSISLFRLPRLSSKSMRLLPENDKRIGKFSDHNVETVFLNYITEASKRSVPAILRQY